MSLEDNAEKLLNLLDPTPAVVETATLAESGKVTQPDAEGPASVNLVVKGKAAGKIQVGPAADATGAGSYEIPVEVPAATSMPYTVRVPTGWHVKTTLTEGAISKGISTPI